MDQFHYKVVHRAGLGNIADFLSRHPLKETVKDNNDDSLEYVNAIVQYSMPIHLSKDVLLKETLGMKF